MLKICTEYFSYIFSLKINENLRAPDWHLTDNLYIIRKIMFLHTILVFVTYTYFRFLFFVQAILSNEFKPNLRTLPSR